MPLQFNAQLTITDPYTGNSILHVPISLKNEAYSIFLINKIKKSDDPVIKHLLNQKDTKSDWLNSPLILAFKKGMSDTITSLLDADAIDVSIGDRFGTLPLHWAALLRYDNNIKQCLAKGADPDIPTRFNHTALELYQYELHPLDLQFQLQYDKAAQCASVPLRTNLPEITEYRFHGFHRKQQKAEPVICELLQTKQHTYTSMEQQYVENFQMQDAIARSAKWVTGREYIPSILPALQKEGERYYGLNPKLPDYAPDSSKVMFGGVRRKIVPDLQNTKNQIVAAMKVYTMQQATQNYNPQFSQSSDVNIDVLPKKKEIPIKDSDYKRKNIKGRTLSHKSPAFFTQDVSQKVIPVAPWVEIKNTPTMIHLKLENTDLILDKTGEYISLKVVKDNKKESIMLEKDDADEMTGCLNEKAIGTLIVTLEGWGITGKEMGVLLRNGIQEYQKNHKDENRSTGLGCGITIDDMD